MPGSEEVKKLHIQIGTDKIIRVTHTLHKSVNLSSPEIKGDPLRKETISVLANILREGRLITEREFKLLGTLLYEVLLENDIGKLLKDVINDGYGYNNEDSSLLRVELEFEENKHKSNAEIKELSSWPWEYLFCSDLGAGMFLSETTQLVLTRRLSLEGGERELLIKEQRPRVLFVSASPDDLEPVQFGDILEMFESHARDNKIDLFKLVTQHENYDQGRTEGSVPEATWQGFRNLVTTKKPHIIHFVGHGQFNDEIRQGEIAFVEKNYKPRWIHETEIARALIGKNSLHLVFLQTCESGKVDKIADTGPYRAISGVASKLAANHIPAIVAMQYKIENASGNDFASKFYQALIANRTIEVAVQEGRAQILENIRGWSVSRAFGVPVLYLRGSGALFAPTTTQIAPPVAVLPPSPPEQLVCAQCGTKFYIDDKICSQCSAYLHCQKCGAPVRSKGAKFCTNCTEPLQLYPKRAPIPGDVYK